MAFHDLARPRTASTRAVACALGALACGLAASPAHASLAQQYGFADLRGATNLRVVPGPRVVAGAGDVNGDRRDDLAVSDGEGLAWIVFGRLGGGTTDLGGRRSGAMLVGTSRGSPAFGSALAGAGDLDGDGLADVVLGDPGAGHGGAVYLLRGRRSREAVDLDDGAAAGVIRVSGVAAGDRAGAAVAGPGDLDGDGRPDLAVAAPGARGGRGAAYVLFGRALSFGRARLDLAGAGVTRLVGGSGGTVDTVAAGRDVNDDGRADLVVAGGRQAWVVFGRRRAWPRVIDLDRLGRAGLRIIAPGAEPIRAVAGLGDTNRDGFGDVAVGLPDRTAADGEAGAGAVFVVEGKTDSAPIDLGLPGVRGFHLEGDGGLDGLGSAVAGPGDVTGDGRADLLVGAPAAISARGFTGAAYLVSGAHHRELVSVTAIAEPDSLLIGPGAGASVAGAGDVNHDGRPDMAVSGAGVLWGFGPGRVSYRSVHGRVGTRMIVRPQVRHTGRPRFAIFGTPPRGLRFDRATGEISGTPRAAARTRSFIVTMRDLTGPTESSVTLGVTSRRASPRRRGGGFDLTAP